MVFEVTGAAIGPGEFWRALGKRPLGATVVTTKGRSGPSGFLGLSFAHVSAHPPTVLVSVGRSTSALPDIIESACFAVNILPAGAERLARAFGGEIEAGARFEQGEWESFSTGAPVLCEAAGVFDCTLLKRIDEGSASIMIGRVVGLRVSDGAGATLASMGGYRDLW